MSEQESKAGIPFPPDADRLVQVTVKGNAMLPLYRHGDMLLASENAPSKFGDRIVVECRKTGWLAGSLLHHGPEAVVLLCGGNLRREVAIPANDINFFGRIVWASQ